MYVCFLSTIRALQRVPNQSIFVQIKKSRKTSSISTELRHLDNKRQESMLGSSPRWLRVSWAPKSAWNCTFCHVSRFSQLPHGDSKVSVQSKNACYHSHYSRSHSSSLKTITFLESSITDIRPISRRPFGRYLISHPTFCRNCPRTKRFVGAYTVCMN